MNHSDFPERGAALTPELIELIKTIQESDYTKFVVQMEPKVVEKVVESTQSGHAGYVLEFTDGSWVAVYLQAHVLSWRTGYGPVDQETIRLINNPSIPDGAAPLPVNYPYSDQICEFVNELKKCHGQAITGIAIGKDSFNFCFPQGMELENMIIPIDSSSTVLRVFWEQW